MKEIAKLLKHTDEEATPLQKKLSKFTSVIAKIVLGTTIIIFLLGVLRDNSTVEMFETAFAISIGGIPESLPIVMTIILVIVVWRNIGITLQIA